MGWQNRFVISMSADHVAALPVDQLGLAVLSDLIATNQWNEYNYLLAVSRSYPRPAAEAVSLSGQWSDHGR
jgi:hypothetical protein